MTKDQRLLVGAFIVFMFIAFLTYFTMLIAVMLDFESDSTTISTSSSQDVADTAEQIAKERR